MLTAPSPVDSVRIRPVTGCGTLQSPWGGWESQVEDGAEGRVVAFEPGFYAVTRPVCMPSGSVLEAPTGAEGRAWFLPASDGRPLDTMFLVDGAGGVTIRGVSFNGGGDRARHGVLVRAGTGIQLDGCRFGDFGAAGGAAIRIDGESPDRPVREIVIRGGRIANAREGIRLGRHTTDLLITDNQFEEVAGPALIVDPADHRSDYGLIFVKNRLRATRPEREGPFVRILSGAEGIRLAENTIEGSTAAPGPGHPAPGVEIRGGGASSSRRLEILLNRIFRTAGPGIAASRCGPGLLAAGNHVVTCGGGRQGGIDLARCHGVLVEDNEVAEREGPGIRLTDCVGTRVNGNEVTGHCDSLARGGGVGLLVEGPETRRLRVTDNRISGAREEGIRVDASRGVRLVGNEVQDCGGGIRVAGATNLLLVGNDCRDNGRCGIRVEAPVRRGLVALNFAILNGAPDLEVLGSRIRCHSNKVDRQGPMPAAAAVGG